MAVNPSTTGTPPPAAGGHGAPHAAAPARGTAGHWIQKGGQWTLIHAVGPGQWVEGTKPGFKAPPKPKGMSGTSANQDWLNPLTPAQVTQQARNELGNVYKPALNDINAQSKQEQAIFAKQESDNQYYQSWLNSKSTALQANQQAVDQQTQALEQQLTGNQTTELGAQTSALTAAATARAGNVSNEAQAFAPNSGLGGYLATTQQTAQQDENARATASLQDEQNAQAQTNSDLLLGPGTMTANAAKESAAFQSAMTKIASTKASELTNEASSISKEIARLEGVQIAVSENNRNFDTAAEKLGVQVANTNSEIASRAATATLNNKKFGLAVTKENNTIAQNAIRDHLTQEGLNLRDKSLQLQSQRLVESVLNTNSEIALRNAETAAKKNGGVLTPHEQNTYFDAIDKASGEINSLMQNNGLTPPEAYQAMLRGYITVPGSNGNTKKVGVPRMANQSVLNAAYNLRSGGSGLTAGDIAYLGKIGLSPAALHSRYGSRATTLPPSSGPNASNPGTQR